MGERELMELKSLDRAVLMGRMASHLSWISGEMGTTPTGIAIRTGFDKNRVKLLVMGKRKMKWSEYLSFLFVLWDDERGREMVEELGLFPEELKNAMSVGRNGSN